MMLRRLHIVTSDWHLKRAKLIFEHVFALGEAEEKRSRAVRLRDLQRSRERPLMLDSALEKYALTFEGVAANPGRLGALTEAQLEARLEKEKRSAQSFKARAKETLTSEAALMAWLYAEHEAYNAFGRAETEVMIDSLKTSY
jgi:hypothetical protein